MIRTVMMVGLMAAPLTAAAVTFPVEMTLRVDEDCDGTPENSVELTLFDDGTWEDEFGAMATWSYAMGELTLATPDPSTFFVGTRNGRQFEGIATVGGMVFTCWDARAN